MNLDLDKPEHKNPFAPSRTRRLVVMVIAVLLLLVVGGVGGAFLASYIAANTVTIPVEVRQKAKSAVYVPGNLPGTYKLDEGSFSFDEEVLIFQVKDFADTRLVFTQQPKPSDFNFEDFYAKEMREAKTLSNVPHTSVWGKTGDGKRTMLSVLAGDTWIIMTTTAPFGESDMVQIVKGMRQI